MPSAYHFLEIGASGIDHGDAAQYCCGMNTNKGLFLLGRGLDGLADPLTPQTLASSHPVWERDVAAHGPWRDAGEGAFSAASWSRQQTTLLCGSCSSTLDVARDPAILERLGDWDGVLAQSQWAGRGQLRRDWSSPAGNMYCALRIPRLDKEWDAVLPLLIGFLCAEALDAFGIHALIKWPNDLLVEGRKVGGILIEERAGCVIAGIGVNIVAAPPAGTLRESWSPHAAALAEWSGDVTPLALWAALVDRCKYWYKSALCGDTSRIFLQRIVGRMAWVGHDVLIHGTEKEFRVTVVGLAPDGGLVVRRDGRQEILYAGSLSPA
ncbi:biotin--[acetyl-CoA-carboxylase] ligase [Desulfobaculum sp. SPO524]|uniref:biotin--[acetyl-CoA-carboxylase] ligase n=1 Tax=Desulfobaculum sp. SPO524 TaxID=3378071 RepID=UPI003851ACD5